MAWQRTPNWNTNLPKAVFQRVVKEGTSLQSQSRAARMISGTQLSLYYGVGIYVSLNSREGTWGTGAIDKISEQLRIELPGLRGFSAQNIRNMRQFAEFWQPYLFPSPAASKLETGRLPVDIEYDRFALEKWSPMASEINRDEFLGKIHCPTLKN